MWRATAVCIGNGIAEVISIHALRGESDSATIMLQKLLKLFQSTPSARRATLPGCCGPVKREISIHALREKGDPAGGVPRAPPSAFQSAISARRTTGCGVCQEPCAAISIRNLHMEGDYRQADCLRRGIHDFNPRPPWGERRAALKRDLTRFDISIHALREESDSAHRLTPVQRTISIHALREEGDQSWTPL